MTELKGQRFSQTLSWVCPLPDKNEKLGLSHIYSPKLHQTFGEF